jgi:hypothetical protein
MAAPLVSSTAAAEEHPNAELQTLRDSPVHHSRVSFEELENEDRPNK